MQRPSSTNAVAQPICARSQTTDGSRSSSALEVARGLLDRLFPEAPTGNVSFQLWDGSPWPDEKPRPATIVLKHPDSLSEMFASGTEIGLAESYLRDDFDVAGDIETACELGDTLADSKRGARFRAGCTLLRLRLQDSARALGRRLSTVARARATRHSLERDRWAIGFHYDVSNDFYRLWLDPRMLYSCAYFKSEGDGLGAAQSEKLAHICRKLRMKGGQSLLDIGCGWGGLAVFAAKHFKAKVTGITLSKDQASFASQAVADAEVSDDVKIHIRDYRELPDSEDYDVIVSVGMSEHVGADNLPEYFRKAFRLLRPGGVFLNHAIGDGVRARETRGRSFIQDYVFPDSDIPRLPIVLAAAESAGFEVRDVENLREHYTHTLRHWVQRLEAKHEAALEFVKEPTYRVWRLYMAACARGFAQGRLAIYQTLLVKPHACGTSNLPLTRGDWYRQ